MKGLDDALRDLVPFLQFQKRENTHGGGVTSVKLQTEAWNLKRLICVWEWLYVCVSLFTWQQELCDLFLNSVISMDVTELW